jgi:hypothetical protein
MKRIVSLALGAALLFAFSGSGFAAQSDAPGQIYNRHHHQNLSGHPGASGYAPGQRYKSAGKTSIPGHPGASGYAPGRK